MPRRAETLSATKVKNAKSKEKDYKMFDGGGLFLLVTVKGSKLWKLKYRINNKEKLLSFGKYPLISLSEARELRDLNKKLIKQGLDPQEYKNAKKQEQKTKQQELNNTFKKIALERLEKSRSELSEAHYKRTMGGFKNYVFPAIGEKLINEIDAIDIINILRHMVDKKIKNSAQKVYQSINKTFKYAVANGYTSRNPASDFDVKEIIGKITQNHYPIITDTKGIRKLLNSINNYGGEFSTKNALIFMAHTFVRPTNIRLALWDEIDLENRQWVIPAHKMKTNNEHIVPLSRQMLELLKEVKKYNGDSMYLFPSGKSLNTPLSDGTFLRAIRKMGYTKEDFTPHGFRGMFSTLANEKSDFPHEVIEIQLAHSVGSRVSQAYNRAQYLDQRVELMQWWSDYLDKCMEIQ